MKNPTDKPMADHGLTSYRYKGRFGWIMIGATDHEDAISEAKRSSTYPVEKENLQIWDVDKYVPAYN